jgi:hypothetical protein
MREHEQVELVPESATTATERSKQQVVEAARGEGDKRWGWRGGIQYSQIQPAHTGRRQPTHFVEGEDWRERERGGRAGKTEEQELHAGFKNRAVLVFKSIENCFFYSNQVQFL